MRQVLLGLDIGTTSIKGVRLSRGLRGLRLLSVFEAPVPRHDAEGLSRPLLSAAQIGVLEDLILEGRIKKNDLLALSLPGDCVSTREMILPFTDLKKIDQIVSYEVEGELPFDLETVTTDYMILNRPAGSPLRNGASSRSQAGGTAHKKETSLLVSAIPNKNLRQYLDPLQALGLDPAWIGISPLSLFSFARNFLDLETAAETEILVIDVGASRTTLCHILAGHLNWIRTIPFGGDSLTEALVESKGLSWGAAEKRKSEVHLVMDDPADENSITERETLEAGIGRLVMEIEKSLRVFSPELSRNAFDSVRTAQEHPKILRRGFHLCGMGASFKGFEAYLSLTLEMLPIEVELEKGSAASEISGIEQVDSESVSRVYAQAFGLALQEADGPPINFRRGEFVFGKETLARRHRLVTLSWGIVILLGLMAGSFYLHYQKKENHYQALKQELRAAFGEIFPNVPNVVNEVEQTRTAITTRRQTGAFFGVDEISPLQILKEITAAIPAGVKIDVFNLSIDGGSVRIQAQTDSFESVDRIRSGLLSANSFKQVEVSDAKAAANKDHVRFQIKMTVLGSENHGKK